MNFDRMAKAAEVLQEPQIYEMVANARLFDFPYTPHKDLAKEYSEDDISFFNENFFLPFQTVAIEDKASCVLIHDPVAGQIGINQQRLFMEMLSTSTDLDQFNDGTRVRSKIMEMPDMHVLSAGSVSNINMTTTNFMAEATVALIALFDKNMNIIGVEQVPDDPDIRRSFGYNCMAAVQEVMYFNTPNKFIVEKRPAKAARGVKIPRSHQRSIYTLMTPKSIREIIPAPREDGKKVAGHERRAHSRYLSSPRYKKKRFTHVMIPAIWVGPSEKQEGKHIWKVMLDK